MVISSHLHLAAAVSSILADLELGEAWDSLVLEDDTGEEEEVGGGLNREFSRVPSGSISIERSCD